MKKSFMSVSMLVVSISVVLVFLCGSIAKAQSAGNKFIYDKKENTETVFTLDQSGRFLTPKLKYEMKKDENGNLLEKKAYRWNAERQIWTPYFLMTFTEKGSDSVVEYALWNKDAEDFSLNYQKAVYNRNDSEEIVTYISYRWNPSEEEWSLNDQALFQNYLAIHTVK